MPRQVRIEFEGALYHVMARGNQRNRIFASPDGGDESLFLEKGSGKGVRERFPNLTQLMVKFSRSMPRQLALEVAEPVTKSKPREPLGLKSEIVP